MPTCPVPWPKSETIEIPQTCRIECQMAFPSQLLSQAPSSEETAKLAAWHLHQLYNLLNHCRFQGPCQVSYYWSRYLVWIVVLHNLPGISKWRLPFRLSLTWRLRCSLSTKGGVLTCYSLQSDSVFDGSPCCHDLPAPNWRSCHCSRLPALVPSKHPTKSQSFSSCQLFLCIVRLTSGNCRLWVKGTQYSGTRSKDDRDGLQST